MALRIRQLSCTVRVKTAVKGGLLHQDKRPEKPSLRFVVPAPAAHGESPAPPGERLTGDQAASPLTPAAKPREVDVRAVADRVYDLMRREIELGRERAGRKG